MDSPERVAAHLARNLARNLASLRHARGLTQEALAKAALTAKLSSGQTFDEETYRKAVPFFKAGIAHFAEAGRDVATMVKHLVRYLAQNGMDRTAIDNMRPYVRRFIEDETKRKRRAG